MKKVLIIKLGYSETLDSRLSLTTSLGDVLRTTVILHFFKNAYVNWLVDRKAVPLLENNKYIHRIWAYNSYSASELKKEKFDVIVNLEKIPKICRFANSLVAKKRFGFRANGQKILTELTQDLSKKKKNKNCWQKIFAVVLSRNWNGQEYILGYKPKPEVKYDIGFNWTTGNKWTNKAWPRIYWEKLGNLLKDKYSISWQQGLGSINEYIDWINSCKLIVTADTLGLHLGLALEKRVVALFGPTSYREIYFYNRGSYLLPIAPYDCMPCLKPHCYKEKQCIEYIQPEKVKERIDEEFKKITIAQKI